MVDSERKHIVFEREDFTEMSRFQGMEHLAENTLGTPRRSRSGTLL